MIYDKEKCDARKRKKKTGASGSNWTGMTNTCSIISTRQVCVGDLYQVNYRCAMVRTYKHGGMWEGVKEIEGLTEMGYGRGLKWGRGGGTTKMEGV